MKNKTSICGWLLLLGSFCAVITDVIGILLHEKHNPISNTISQLAYGKYGYIQDIGLVVLGISQLITGLVISNLFRNDKKLLLGFIGTALIGVTMIVLSGFNDFAGEPGTITHIIFALIIGILFPVTVALISLNIQNISKVWFKAGVAISITYLLLLAGFFFIPENIEGAYERLLGLLFLSWYTVTAYYFINKKSKFNS